MQSVRLNLLLGGIIFTFGVNLFAMEIETCEGTDGNCEITMTERAFGGTCNCTNQPTSAMFDGDFGPDASAPLEFSISEFCNACLVYACGGDESTVDDAVLTQVSEWIPKPSGSDNTDSTESNCSVSSVGAGRLGLDRNWILFFIALLT